MRVEAGKPQIAICTMGFQARRPSPTFGKRRAWKPIVRRSIRIRPAWKPIVPRSIGDRCAMTLIELVVSALLASLMMTALTSIVWSSARETRHLQRDATSHFPTTQLAQQLRTDFANARGMLAGPQGLTLHGFLGSDPATTRAMLTPGNVRYHVSRINEHPVLIRSTTNSREAVWVGCSSLRIESMAQVDREDEFLPQPESGGLPDIPARFRVILFDEDGQVLWREVVHHHED